MFVSVDFKWILLAILTSSRTKWPWFRGIIFLVLSWISQKAIPFTAAKYFSRKIAYFTLRAGSVELKEFRRADWNIVEELILSFIFSSNTYQNHFLRGISFKLVSFENLIAPTNNVLFINTAPTLLCYIVSMVKLRNHAFSFATLQTSHKLLYSFFGRLFNVIPRKLPWFFL